MWLVPSLPHTPLTIDALLRLIAERDAEVALLKLMVDKLKLQLARRAREQYGSSSEQLTLISTEAPQHPSADAKPLPRTAARIPKSAADARGSGLACISHPTGAECESVKRRGGGAK